MVSFPTSLLSRLMPVLPKAHCQPKLWWPGAWEGGGGTEAQLGYMVQPLYPPPPPTPSSPCITPSLHLSPIGLRVLRARKGRKGLIGRSECPGYTDSMDFGPPWLEQGGGGGYGGAARKHDVTRCIAPYHPPPARLESPPSLPLTPSGL